MKKTKKFVRVLALCLTLGVMLSGCGGGDAKATDPTAGETTPATEPERTKQFGLSYDPEAGMNPYSCTTLINRTVMSLLYQGLFTVTSAYEAEPVLCKRYQVSADEKTYTFTLESAVFSDGAPLTGKDVAASLRAARGSAMYGDRLQYVESISVNEEGQVVLTLTTPYEMLPLLLDIPIVPADETEKDFPLGTGPYRLAQTDTETRLQRVQSWWCEYPSAVQYDTVHLTATTNPAKVRDNFEFGGTDVVCADPSARSYVAFRCDYELWDCATGILLYLASNRSSGIFANENVRAALTHGIQRENLMSCYSGFAQAAYLPASPAAACYDTALAANYAFDQAALTKALSDAGVYGMEATLLVDGSDSVRVAVAELVARQLEQCGLKISITQRTGETYAADLKYGRFDLYLGEIRLSPNFDLTPFFASDGAVGSYGGMASGTLYQQNLAALENSGNYYELYKAVMDDGRLCPLLFRTYAVYATRGVAANLLPGLDNVFHTANNRQLADAKG